MTDVELRDLFAAHALGGLIAQGRFAAIRDNAGRNTLANEDSQTAISMLCEDALLLAERMLRTVRPKATGEKKSRPSLQELADKANR